MPCAVVVRSKTTNDASWSLPQRIVGIGTSMLFYSFHVMWQTS